MAPVAPSPVHASTFRALFETAPDAMIACDALGTIVLANPQAEKLFGYDRETMCGLSVEALIPGNVHGRHRQHRARYVAEPHVRPMGAGQELSGSRADGSQFPVEIALSPIETPDGLFFVASIRDISETQRARQALTRARYNAIVADIGRLMLESVKQDAGFDHIPQMIVSELGIDVAAIVSTQAESGRVRMGAEAGLKPELQELLPELLSADEFTRMSRPSEASFVRYLGTDDAEGGRHHPALAAAGYLDFAAAPLFDRSQPMGALVAASRAANVFDEDKIHFLQSVANLLAATMQRNRTEEQLAHAQRLDAVGQLTGGVAHDFNNMLTVISGNLQLLEIELADRPGDLEILASALRAVDRGSGLTRKLLAFAGRQHLNPQAIDPCKLLNELAVILGRTLGEAINVEVECAASLPFVLVDPGELDTAILNLALNARDAMPRGGTLRLSAHERAVAGNEGADGAAPGNYVAMTVSDTGLGMTPEVLARAFEPFFTTKDIGRGSGLGLSMVYGFVRQSGGELRADSRLGYGTRVELLLPAVRPVTAAPASGGLPLESQSGQRETILVVEDEVEVRAVALAFLQSLGYATLDASDSEHALEMLGIHPEVSLLFSDVILGSGMNGNELAREARRLRPGLPVLLTSGYEASTAPTAAPQPALLRKPYQRQELARAIRGAIDGASVRINAVRN